MCSLNICSKTKDKRAEYRNFASSLFLTVLYIVFASVSTTIFDTFNCQQIGDDPKWYLARDQSIDCSNSTHQFYVKYAAVMVFIYPVGIPLTYFVCLWMHRKEIQEPNRDYNPMIQKTSFLWANYEPHLWWFEVFECARRLALSGILVFVSQGR